MDSINLDNINPALESNPFHDVQLVLYGQADCPSGYSFGPYIRDIYLFHFVTDGEGKFCISDKEYRLQKGDVFFIPPGILTYYEADTTNPWSYTWIGLRGMALPQLMKAAGFSKNTPILHYSDTVFHSLGNIFSAADSSGFDSLETTGYLYFFLNELVKCENENGNGLSPQNAYIDTALKYINQNIYEHLSVSQLSDLLGIDRSYFCALFKKYLGISPQQYITNLKIDKAKTFLEMTEVDIKYISTSLGYEDLYTFSHFFKRKTGLSPKDWRKLYH